MKNIQWQNRIDYMGDQLDMILNNPKKAIVVTSIPIAIAILVQSLNNIVDMSWVSSLGNDAMAAVGLVSPLYSIIHSFGIGLGVGATFALGKRLGVNNRKGASSFAGQAILISLIFSVILTIILLILAEPMLSLIGGADMLQSCLEYAIPIFSCATVLILNAMLLNMLRAEGSSKIAMYAQILCAIINLCLDPLFIFGLEMGLAGAAWATVVAYTISLIVMIWIFVKGKTDVKLVFDGFKIEKESITDIGKLAIPICLESFIISFAGILLNGIFILAEGGTDNIAVYASTWKVLYLLCTFMWAMEYGIVPIVSSALSSKRFKDIEITYKEMFKINIISMMIIAIILSIFAKYIAILFSYSDVSENLQDDLTLCISILAFIMPISVWGYTSSGLFQGIGHGKKLVVCSFVRIFVKIVVCYLAVTLAGTALALWIAVLISEIILSFFMGYWGWHTMKNLDKTEI